MPITRIEVKKIWPTETKQQIIDSVQAAMVETLKIPERDKLFRFIEHREENFIAPPGASENYTLVEITLFSGRSLDAKRNLYRSIVKRLGEFGIQPNDIRILLHEEPLDNWGIRGGIPASEVELGFEVNV